MSEHKHEAKGSGVELHIKDAGTGLWRELKSDDLATITSANITSATIASATITDADDVWTPRTNTAASLDGASMSTTAANIVDADANIIGVVIRNTTAEDVFIKLGGDATSGNYHVKLANGEDFRIDTFTGVISGITAANTSALQGYILKKS
jgi:hypothetical protein